jgi:hypothetical protein
LELAFIGVFILTATLTLERCRLWDEDDELVFG